MGDARPQTSRVDRREELLQQVARARTKPTAGPRVADLLATADPLAWGPDCPTPATLEHFVTGELRGRRREAVRAHLFGCPHCRAYAENVRRASQAPHPIVAPPAPTIGVGHVLGLAIAGVLLLIANSAVVDWLATLETAPTVQRAAPAESTVPPAPVAEDATLLAPAVPAGDAGTTGTENRGHER